MPKLEKPTLKKLYEKDFYLWVMKNLKLLREKHYEEVDWENLLEEIEYMARRELRSVISYMAVILEHLYKWEHYRVNERMGNSWVKSIMNARRELDRLYRDMPSLYGKSQEGLEIAWQDAVMGLITWFRYPENKNLAKKFFKKLPTKKDLPAKCPYTFEQVLGHEPWLKEVEHEEQHPSL